MMQGPSINRRDLLGSTLTALAGLALSGTMPANATSSYGEPTPFVPDDVVALARAMAGKSYMQPKSVPKPWLEMTYDQYRDIRFPPERSIWRDQEADYELQLFAPGFYFQTGVMIDVVENGESRQLLFNPDLFNFGELVPDLPIDAQLGFSGFRVHGHINNADYKDEFLVFQGASYFRAVAKGQAYGLSARGLALKTADPRGEEFPSFRRFWVEKPEKGAAFVTVHALLDSESVCGAYSFDITPGDPTRMECRSVLFPRVTLDHVGVAPLTSMFLFDTKLKKRFDDFRGAVHDNDGLMVLNGNGEYLWRPLANPLTLQVSNFLDTDPKGFGLIQRNRDFDDYNDLEADYERRPSLWIEPREGWGKGAVSLVEIPTDEEIFDNIVAYWRPSEPLEPGKEYSYSYGLSWGNGPAAVPGLARVAETSFGKHPVEGRLVVLDFEPLGEGAVPAAELTHDIHVIGGTFLRAVLQDNPHTGGTRLAFSFDPGETEIVELRAQLRHQRRSVSEVWLYRWMAQ